MRPVSWRMLCVVAACGAGWLGCGEAAAQSLGGTTTSGAVSPGVPVASSGAPMASAPAASILAYPIVPALGSSTQGGALSNPLMAPLLYNSMLQASQPQSQSQAQANALYGPTGLATSQLGLMLLANQQASGGIGSGRISGTRPDPRARDAGSSAQQDAKQRTLARPGGLASRYFNRVGPHTAYPKNYFNRRPRYFP
jgi:hypothetical protein